MGKTCIQVGERWRIVRRDELNWQLWELKKIKDTGKARGTDRVGTLQWQPLQRFYNRPELAAQYILDHSTDEAGKMTAQQFIELSRETVKKLSRQIAKVDV